MYIKKKFILLIIGAALLLIGLEANLESIRRDFRNSLVSSTLPTHFSRHYLHLRPWITKYKNPESLIAVAFHTARQPAQTYLALVENGGISLSLLSPITLVGDRQNDIFRVQAAYEAMALLVRMPLDEELFQLGDRLSGVLVQGLKKNEKDNPDETFVVKEVLSMYVARKSGEPKLMDGMLSLSGDNTEWRNDLSAVRIGLAACAQRLIEVPPPAWGALSRGFGPKWLNTESTVGWDLALSKTVSTGNASDDCKKFSNRFSAMVNFSTKE